jgi:hypothetical protein
MQARIQKNAAITIGISLIIMAIAAGVTVGNFQTKLWIRADANATVEAWSSSLFTGLMICWGVIVLSDALVSWAVCAYYRNAHKKLATISSVLRWIYTLLLGIAVYKLSFLLGIHDQAESALKIWESFEQNWQFALIIFGIHLLFWGILSWRDGRAPKWLSIALIAAGISYTLISILKYYFPQIEQITNLLETILVLPMIVGELGMGIWLLGWGWRKTVLHRNRIE